MIPVALSRRRPHPASGGDPPPRLAPKHGPPLRTSGPAARPIYHQACARRRRHRGEMVTLGGCFAPPEPVRALPVRLASLGTSVARGLCPLVPSRDISAVAVEKLSINDTIYYQN